MKIKFIYIQKIVLLFLCKYNTDYAELNLFFETIVAKQKYNSYNYVKINVFTPNSRGLWHQFGVRPACTPCCLTRINTVGCSDSYFDIDIPNIYNG